MLATHLSWNERARRAEPPSAWILAHEALSRLAKQRALADAEEGRCLLAALRAAAHVHLGFGTFTEYVERLFGYKPKSTQEKLRVAEALELLPVMTDALESGTLTWSAVRELTRVAAQSNEHEWLELARGKTLRQLEELVAGKHLGDSPDSPPDPSARRYVLRFEVTADTYALFREAIAELRRRSNGPLGDDSALSRNGPPHPRWPARRRPLHVSDRPQRLLRVAAPPLRPRTATSFP